MSIESLIRALQRLAGLAGLLALSPILAIAAMFIWFEDKGPVFYHQTRVGKNNQPFRLWKLRSMRVSNQGTSITRSGDPRVTRTGGFLRKYKIDELPQLWNVARGDMGFIGPRPEVPEYVDPGNPLWRNILEHTPGITGLAALMYRNEEQLLGSSSNPEAYYRETLLPAKLRLDVSYADRRSATTDLALLFLTIRLGMFHSRPEPGKIHKMLMKGVPE